MLAIQFKTVAEYREQILAMIDQEEKIDLKKVGDCFDSQSEAFGQAFNELLAEEKIKVVSVVYSQCGHCPRFSFMAVNKIVRC